MANQNGNGNQGNVVSSQETQDMFAQFLAAQGMSIDSKGVVTQETVVDEVDEFFDAVIDNVQKEIDVVNEKDDGVYNIYKGKNGAKVLKFSKALLSDEPVVEYRLQHKQSNADVIKGLEKLGFKFEYIKHHSKGNPMRKVTHADGPDRMSTMGRFNKTTQTKGLKEFRLM